MRPLSLLLVACVSFHLGCEIPTKEGLESDANPSLSASSLGKTSLGKTQYAQTIMFDEELADLARAVPGFGGLYFEEGQLVVYAKSDGDNDPPSASWQADLIHELRERMQAGRLPLIPVDHLTGATIRSATFDFEELNSWKNSLADQLFESRSGVLSLGIREDENLIRVGISDSSAIDFVVDVVSRIGMPEEALRIEKRDPVELDVATNHTNMVAGLQIQNSLTGSACTLGPVVLLPDVFQGHTVEGFLTASHCTREVFEFGPVSDPFYQATIASGKQFASELVDPAPQSSGCGVSNPCVFADAVFLQWNSSSGTSFNLGEVIRTTYRGTSNGSTTASGVFTVNGDGSGYLTQEVNKIGRTTGWTYGTITDTCEHWVHPSGPVVQCQWEASYGSSAGDSGSPVFTWDGSSNEISLAGMHWGRSGSTRIYSPMNMIRGHIGSNLVVK